MFNKIITLQAFLKKILQIIQPTRISVLFRKMVYTFRAAGFRGVWLASRRYLQKQFILLGNNQIDIHAYIRQQMEKVISTLQPVSDGIIFISHDASTTGAPITLLNQCKAYKQVYGNNLVIVLISGGPLLEEFRAVAPVIDLYRDPTNIIIDENIKYVFLQLKQLGYSRCVANTVVSGALEETLRHNQIQTIFEIHELLELIRNAGWSSYAKKIAQSGSIVLFPAHYVADKFVENFSLPLEQLRILPQGVVTVYPNGKQAAREQLLQKLGLLNSPEIKILLGAGFAHLRKGTDLFCEVAAEFYKKHILHVHFVWLGNRNEYFEDWKNNTLPRLPYKTNLHFLDFDPHPEYIFAGADIFLLTSREDPFPSVALDALANDTPVITFKDTGGIEEILDGNNGIVVAHLNVQKMANAAWEILQKPDKMQPSTTKLHTYPEYIKILMSFFPNHESGRDTLHTNIALS